MKFASKSPISSATTKKTSATKMQSWPPNCPRSPPLPKPPTTRCFRTICLNKRSTPIWKAMYPKKERCVNNRRWSCCSDSSRSCKKSNKLLTAMILQTTRTRSRQPLWMRFGKLLRTMRMILPVTRGWATRYGSRRRHQFWPKTPRLNMMIGTMRLILEIRWTNGSGATRNRRLDRAAEKREVTINGRVEVEDKMEITVFS